jgi:hypothetical protein
MSDGPTPDNFRAKILPGSRAQRGLAVEKLDRPSNGFTLRARRGFLRQARLSPRLRSVFQHPIGTPPRIYRKASELPASGIL